MPRKPKRPCRYPGCANLCDKGVYCAVHVEFTHDHLRGNSASRGYDGKWRATRALFLKKNLLCAKCRENGKLTPATVVDHIVPHRGDPILFWDRANWRSLCKDCHDHKTGSGL